MNRLIFFLKLLGTRNYYEGVDKPNPYQWIYKWRIGVKTAWKVACIIYPL
jgi:hypothetical protein